MNGGGSSEENNEYYNLKQYANYNVEIIRENGGTRDRNERRKNNNPSIQPNNPYMSDSKDSNLYMANGICGNAGSLEVVAFLRDHNNPSELEQPLIEYYHEEKEMNFQQICELSIKLGCTSFGGPLAHQELIFQKVTVENKFLTEKHFRHILNLCLVLPGYSSSTLLAAICGIKKNSILGGLLAMLLFNIPSLIGVLLLSLMIKVIKQEIATGVGGGEEDPSPLVSRTVQPIFLIILTLSAGVCQAALGLIIQAAINLTKKLSYSAFQIGLILFAGLVYYLIPHYSIMVILIIICGLVSSIKGDHDYLLDHIHFYGLDEHISKIQYAGLPCLTAFALIYGLAYTVDFLYPNIYVFLFESFFRIGSLSFGEGHVIIPMILTEYTNNNLIEEAEVLNGYALISLLPGSMFNLAAYSGVICLNILGGLIANLAIFIPGFLLVFGALPYVDKIKDSNFFQFFVRGANSAAIGFIYTAAIILWIDSCFINPYTNPVTGSLNVLMCYILSEAFKLHKPFVILFGAASLLGMTYMVRVLKIGGFE